MRLIDADALMSDIGSYSLEVEAHNHDSQLEKMRKVVQAVQDHSVQCIENRPSIDPETLPIVQELRKDLERVTKERDEIATLCGKLGVLCDQPQKKRQELFLKYRGSMIGDYMGSGYPFVDAFNRIIDDFMLTMSDGAYKAVMEAANKEIQSKRKPLEVQKDE